MPENNANNVIPISRIGKRHLQILLVFMGLAIASAGLFSMSVAIVAMTDAQAANPNFPEFDWNSQIKSYILTSSLWSYVAFQLFSGYIVNKFRAKKLICAAVCMNSAINVLVPLLATYLDWGGVLCCQILMGLAQSCLLPSTHSFVVRWSPIEERSRVGALIVYAPSFGNIIALPISGGIASSSLGWPGIFYVFGGSGILWCILFYHFGVDSPSEHGSISEGEKLYIIKSQNSLESSEQTKLKIPWKSIATSGAVWTLAANHASQGWLFYIFLSKLPAYVKSVLKYDVRKSGLMSTLPYIVECSLILPYGWICDFAIRKGIRLSVIRKVINTYGSWGAATALLALCLVPHIEGSITPLLIIVVLFALNSSNLCGFNINHIDIAPNFVGTLIAIFTAVENLSAQFALLACGYIVTDESDVNQWNIIFYVVSGLYFLSNLIFVVFGKCEPQPWNEPAQPPPKESKA